MRINDTSKGGNHTRASFLFQPILDHLLAFLELTTAFWAMWGLFESTAMWGNLWGSNILSSRGRPKGFHLFRSDLANVAQWKYFGRMWVFHIYRITWLFFFSGYASVSLWWWLFYHGLFSPWLFIANAWLTGQIPSQSWKWDSCMK